MDIYILGIFVSKGKHWLSSIEKDPSQQRILRPVHRRNKAADQKQQGKQIDRIAETKSGESSISQTQ